MREFPTGEIRFSIGPEGNFVCEVVFTAPFPSRLPQEYINEFTAENTVFAHTFEVAEPGYSWASWATMLRQVSRRFREWAEYRPGA